MRKVLALAVICAVGLSIPFIRFSDNGAADAADTATGLPLTTVSQSATTLIVSWTPVDGAAGYVFRVDGARVSNTWDATKSGAKFHLVPAPPAHKYEVVAVMEGPSGAVTLPKPPPPPPPTTTAPTTTRPPPTTTAPSTTTTTTLPSVTLGSALRKRLPLSSGGRTFWVAGAGSGVAGSDSNDGTTRTPSGGHGPFLTINRAISIASSGDVIVLETGSVFTSASGASIYSTVLSVSGKQWSASNPVTIKAETKWGAQITAATPAGGPFTYGAALTDVTGLRIQGIWWNHVYGTDGGSGSSVMRAEGVRDVEFDEDKFTDIGGQFFVIGDPSTGGDRAISKRVDVVGCYFEGFGRDAHGGYYDSQGTHFLYMGGSQSQYGANGGVDDSLIEDNLFVGTNPGYHVQLGPQARHVVITNNTFYSNRSANPYARDFVNVFSNVAGDTEDDVVKNNVMVDSTGSALDGSGSVTGPRGFSFDRNVYSLIGGPVVQYVTAPGSNVNADPKFVAPAVGGAGDFHLQPSSPAIGEADPAYTPPFDFDDRARVTADAGAFAAP